MLILSMLSSSPKNGVEIMDEIETTTRGWWRPSPGSVYPVLENLSKDGLVRKRDDGRYELTEKADSEFDEWGPFAGRRRRQAESVEEMLREMASYVSYFEEIKKSSGKQSKDLSLQDVKIKDLIDRLTKLTKSA
jgi:DNA-binding PadR family transcriptional regulator